MFTSKIVRFRFEVMLFSPMNATAAIQRMINGVLMGYIVGVYIVDVVVFLETLEEHILDFKAMRHCIAEYKLKTD